MSVKISLCLSDLQFERPDIQVMSTEIFARNVNQSFSMGWEKVTPFYGSRPNQLVLFGKGSQIQEEPILGFF